MSNLLKSMSTLWAVIALAIVTIAFSPPGSARASSLAVGSAAPDFSTEVALAGKASPFNLAAQLKKGPVVLFFFPKVFTAGCTAEANEFAEKTADFKKAGAVVIGLSADKMEEISKFSVEECRNKFAVGRASPAIIKAYGVLSPTNKAMTSRTSFVIARDGKIALVYTDSDYRPHVKKTLAAVQAMAAKK